MMRRFRILMQSLVAGTIAVSLLGTGAHAAETDALKVFGYINGAIATPVAFQYNQPSFGVPATPTFEIRYMHSESHIDSGPSGRALSSVVWPGDLAGNAPPSLVFDTFLPRDLLEQTDQEDDGWQQFRQGIVDGASSSPPYPVRAESFYPQDPHHSTNDVGGGMSMESAAVEREAEATTTGSKSSFPGLFAAQHLNSSVFSGIRDGIAVSEATAEVKNMNLLGGLIQVQSLKTSKIVSSDGVKATIHGGLSIAGLTINGVRVIGADDGGVDLGGQGFAWDQARSVIHDQLEPRGITVKLAEIDQGTEGPQGRSHVFGLSIRLDSHAMNEFAESLPQPLRDYVKSPGSSPAGPAYNQLPGTATGFVDSIVQFDQSMTVLLGDVSVSAVASPPFDLGLPPIIITDPAPPLPGAPAVIGDTPQPAAPQPAASAPPVFAPATRPVAASTGVPTALAIFAFVVAAGATGGLRMFADRATACADPASGRCTLTQ